MRSIFVDGYNVINSWPELREIKEYSLESAREKLIEILQNYSAYNGYKLFVVFDAHLQSGSIEKREKLISNLVVIYTKEGQTADEFIEKTINSIGRKIDVCVVTSDSLEQQVIFQRGATRLSSLEFHHEVKDVESKIKIETEKEYLEKRHSLKELLQKDVFEQLEKIRRS
jgi:predicted RNA-binding protein with PIN domain